MTKVGVITLSGELLNFEPLILSDENSYGDYCGKEY